MLSAVAEVISTSRSLMSLWKHECSRVFADRFTTQEDKDWFERAVRQASDLSSHISAVVFMDDSQFM